MEHMYLKSLPIEPGNKLMLHIYFEDISAHVTCDIFIKIKSCLYLKCGGSLLGTYLHIHSALKIVFLKVITKLSLEMS